MSDDAERHPWDRLDSETDKAFEAFCIYRDLGPSVRSLRRVVEKRRGYPKKTQKVPNVPPFIKRWSSKFRWVERARAWDIEQDRLVQEQFAAENLQRRRAHAEHAERLQEQLLETFEMASSHTVATTEVTDALGGVNAEAVVNLEARSVIEARTVKAYQHAVDIERTARGMSSEIVEQRTTTTEGPAEFIPKDAGKHYDTMLGIIAGLNLPATHTDPKKGEGGSDGEEPTS